MFYRFLRILNAGFPLVLLYMYMSLFVLALALIFIFPPGSLIIFLACVLSLIPAVILRRFILEPIERMTARYNLRRDRCPWCREGPLAATSESTRCTSCGTLYESNGHLTEEDPKARQAALTAMN